MTKVKTHIMFQGDAQNAVNLYASVFKDFQIDSTEYYDENGHENAGSLKLANISFAGHELIIFDSPPIHDFTFTPSMSIFVDVDTMDDLEMAFEKLSHEGKVLMPLDNYGFSQRYGWISDRYGVSWQLNLPG